MVYNMTFSTLNHFSHAVLGIISGRFLPICYPYNYDVLFSIATQILNPFDIDLVSFCIFWNSHYHSLWSY